MLSERIAAVILSSTDCDVYHMPRLEGELAALSPGQSVVDCRNVAYLDSSGLSAFIRTLKRLRERQADSNIALINVAPNVRKVFELTSLDSVFRIS